MNKELEYLIDKNNNPILCCFEGTCTNYATIDIGIDGNIIPICDKHLEFLKDGYWFCPGENGAYYPSKIEPTEEILGINE